ncbi:flagellar type III secretion system protein FlhB [Exilibacterium tricleocarpae]|uniref:Flagellar biosynthetic protein FlhB n=1 Tax=Exilibacterium tricleocarpae TaxID=2591008 RepID=A0A545U411_9GAMM|nr:flagellar biosynthesis protein FlhB [Exilibacterium tricleocarpae]TQV84186.1 flagellar type III secretion system protein FlhB [Exilibacterium tricleocarpae]
MAAEDNSQEKTEQPTPKRLEKAREEGQVPRSRELTTTAVLLAGTVGLYIFGEFIAARLLAILRYNFAFDRAGAFDTSVMISHLAKSFADGLIALIPLFVLLLIAALAGPVALGGWLWSTNALAPKFSRINPIEGLKRMFSAKALVELAKALAKVGVVLVLAVWLLASMRQDMLDLANQAVHAGIVHSVQMSAWAAIALSAVTVLIAVVDVPFQMWDHTRKLKMSRQDIKDETKDTEGKPEVKSRIRQLQREMSNQRMMAAVPEADVVITNPTHFSVALKYDPDTMETPVVLAKGVEHNAMKIREIARAHRIDLVAAPLLARAVYYTTEVEEEIPGALYMAVAQVLAYVFQLRNYRRGQGQKPVYPRNIVVPPDMRFD